MICNRWKDALNHDAAWVFLKLVYGGQGVRHVKLMPDGHSVLDIPGVEAPPAQMDAASDSTGFFIYPYRAYGFRCARTAGS